MTLFQPSREQVTPKLDKETVQNQFFFWLSSQSTVLHLSSLNTMTHLNAEPNFWTDSNIFTAPQQNKNLSQTKNKTKQDNKCMLTFYYILLLNKTTIRVKDVTLDLKACA